MRGGDRSAPYLLVIEAVLYEEGTEPVVMYPTVIEASLHEKGAEARTYLLVVEAVLHDQEIQHPIFPGIGGSQPRRACKSAAQYL
eukprot:scaffold256748_cov24-Tisochrysis_lutea.AAC.2